MEAVEDLLEMLCFSGHAKLQHDKMILHTIPLNLQVAWCVYTFTGILLSRYILESFAWTAPRLTVKHIVNDKYRRNKA